MAHVTVFKVRGGLLVVTNPQKNISPQLFSVFQGSVSV